MPIEPRMRQDIEFVLPIFAIGFSFESTKAEMVVLAGSQEHLDRCGGCGHHIIARGIECGKVFRDDQDCDFFLKQRGEPILETKTKFFARALIPNHSVVSCSAPPYRPIRKATMTWLHSCGCSTRI